MAEDQNKPVDWAARLKQGTTEQQIPAAARPGDGASQLNSTEQNIGGLASTEDRKTNAEDNKSNETQTQPQKQDDGTVKLTKKDDEGNITTVSALSEEDATKAQETAAKLPQYENLTQSLEGVPGNTNLTDGGRLNSDKSMRGDQSIEEYNDELNRKAGPNPMPNRDGNERTKAYNAMAVGGPDLMFQMDRNTNRMAERLSEIRKAGTLTEQDKQDLAQMEKDLRQTGRV